jgi:hypothetical protein
MRPVADRGVIILNFERGLNFEFRMEATDFEKVIYSTSPSI